MLLLPPYAWLHAGGRRAANEKMSDDDEGWAAGLQADVYRTVFDESCEPLLIMRGDRFVDGNRASLKLLDYDSKNEFLKHNREPHPADLSPERQPDGRRSRDKAQEIMSIVQVVGHHEFDWLHLDAKGRELPVAVCLTSLAGISSDPSLMAVAWRDRRSPDATVPDGGPDLRRLERFAAVGRRATQLVHDINGMMTAVRGCAQMLHDDCEDMRMADASLQGILTAVDTASSWSRELLRYVASPEREQAEPFGDLGEVVDRLAPLLDQLAGPEVVLRPAVQSCPVAATASDLEQVLVNLIVNAAEAMPGGGFVDVIVEPDRQVPGMVRLEVCDTGPGMAAAARERAFEPFFTTKENGSGLGLASVRAIVAAAKGSVEVASRPGDGCVIVVRLPAVAPVG